jgi:CubicO group peptidase (beta-lactamase class C family)
MSRWLSGCVLGPCLAALVVPLSAAEPPRKPVAEKIDAIIRAAGVTDDGPGVAVEIIHGGRVVFRKGYGLANLEDKKPITPHTTFELASGSKPFTAMAVCLLHDRGKLAFDDPVRKYVLELPVYNRAHPIRIRDLLHHTSGLPTYFNFEEPKGRHAKYLDNEDYAPEFARQQEKFPQVFPAGAKYQYENSNYLLLALIVERVSGKSYGTFLHDEIFEPLGMKHSWVYENPDAVQRHPALGYVNAVAYTKKKKGDWKPSWGSPPFRSERLLTVGDGGVWTSLEDMALWDAGIRDGKLLKPETMRRALLPSKTRDGETNDYGFGWILTLEDGRLTRFCHNGSWGGFESMYWRDVVHDRSIILLSNRGGFNPDKTTEQLDELFSKTRQHK